MEFLSTNDIYLVILSIFITIISSYIAFDLTSRVKMIKSNRQFYWLAGSAVVMGGGFWSMHFLAILAMKMPIHMNFNSIFVLISIVIPIAAARASFYLVNREPFSRYHFLGANLLMVIGIIGMHYIGMLSIEMNGELKYDPFFTFLAILVAFTASYLALKLIRIWQSNNQDWAKMASGVVMGLTVSGTHYTAMAGTHFVGIETGSIYNRLTMDHYFIGLIIGMIMLTILVIALFGSYYDRRLVLQTLKLNRSEEKYRSLFEHHPDAVFSLDLHGKFIDGNQNVERISGYSFDEILGTSFSSVIVDRDIEQSMEYFQKTVNGEYNHFQLAIKHKHEQCTQLSIVFMPIIIEGKINGVYGIAKDITEQQHRLIKYHELFENANDAIYLFFINDDGMPGRFIEVNQTACERFGYGKEELLTMSPADITDSSRLELLPEIQAVALKRGGLLFEGAYITKDGRKIPTEINAKVFTLGNKKVGLAISRDITERKKFQEQLKASENNLKMAQRIAQIGSWEWNMIKDKIYWSDEMYKIFRISAKDFNQTYNGFLERVHPNDKQFVHHAIEQAIQGKPYDLEYRIVSPCNEVIHVHAFGELIFNEQYVPERMVGTVQDITNRKLNEEKIYFLANHDDLTGLSNRRYFTEQLTKALITSKNEQSTLAVLFIDLDHFKLVNDTLGHAVGDLLLKNVAERLVTCIGQQDVPSRLGGDEFTIFLMDSSNERASEIAQRILNELSKAFLINDHEVFITPSIGISLFPSDGKDAQSLIKSADLAMYEAKKQGKNSFQFYNPGIEIELAKK